jgi:3D (Asp-Asp-Asp) domain-containing protein
MHLFKKAITVSVLTLGCMASMLFPSFAGTNVETANLPYEVTETNTVNAVSPLGKSLGAFKLTAYYPGVECNGQWGDITALGTKITPGRTIAVDRRVIPLGTWVYINIPGQGWTKYMAEDTGGAIKGNRIDVAVHNRKESYLDCFNGYAEVRLANF